jgi:predicted small metal-binding protein
MSMILECIVPGCAAQVVGESEEEILRQAADHGAKHHGMETVDPPTVEKLRRAIRKR